MNRDSKQKSFDADRNRRFPNGGPLLLLLLILTVGLLLGLQGWRSQIIYADMLRHVDNADRLLSQGKIPDSGVLTSYASYTPPGLTWFYVPGMLLFSDPRLYDFVGRALLYVLTVTGVFLLARSYFGDGYGLLAAALYGFSELGLTALGVLYDRFALHCFCVWSVYWIVQWVNRENAKYLSLALLTFVAGLYTFPEMAPAVFIFPAVWLLYRAPVKIVPLLIAGVLSAVIVFPYFRFERARAFADIKSLVTRQNILPSDYKKSWCDPSLILNEPRHSDQSQAGQGAASAGEKGGGRFRRAYSILGRVLLIDELLPSFNQVARLAGVNIVFLWLTLTGLFALTVNLTSVENNREKHQFRQKSLDWLAFGMIILALLGNEFVAARLSSDGVIQAETRWLIRQTQIQLGLLGVILYKRKSLYSMVAQIPAGHRVLDNTRNRSGTMPLALSFVIPWFVLFFLVSNDKFERFQWLWSLQILILIAPFALLRHAVPKVVLWIGQTLLLVAIVANPLLWSRVSSWVHQGWSGSDSYEINAIDYVARDIRAHGATSAAIGYALHDGIFLAPYHSVDSLYKVGSFIDFFFSRRHQLTNTNVCAEGFAQNDEYRIIRVDVAGDEPEPTSFNVGLDHFQLLQQFGPYQVFKRQ
jgi:hypothetical protein